MSEGLLVLALDICSDFVGISDMSKTSRINHRKDFKKNSERHAPSQSKFVKRRDNIKRYLLWNVENRAG